LVDFVAVPVLMLRVNISYCESVRRRVAQQKKMPCYKA